MTNRCKSWGAQNAWKIMKETQRILHKVGKTWKNAQQWTAYPKEFKGQTIDGWWVLTKACKSTGSSPLQWPSRACPQSLQDHRVRAYLHCAFSRPEIEHGNAVRHICATPGGAWWHQFASLPRYVLAVLPCCRDSRDIPSPQSIQVGDRPRPAKQGFPQTNGQFLANSEISWVMSQRSMCTCA